MPSNRRRSRSSSRSSRSYSSRSSSRSYSRSRSRSPPRERNNGNGSMALVRVNAPMPDPDSVLVKDFLYSLHESNAARSDQIDCKIYIDNLPKGTDSDEFLDLFTRAMQACGLISRPGSPIKSFWAPQDGRFIFIDFRSVEEANNSLTFQGTTYKGSELKVSRPKHYTGSQPTNSSSMTSLFGNYASKNTYKRALEDIARKPLPAVRRIDPPSNVIKLKNIISNLQDLENESEYLDIMEDIRIECSKYGTVLSVFLPKPGAPHGVGSAYVEFNSVEDAKEARRVLSSKRFGGRFVDIGFHPEPMYHEKDFREIWQLHALRNEPENES